MDETWRWINDICNEGAHCATLGAGRDFSHFLDSRVYFESWHEVDLNNSINRSAGNGVQEDLKDG